jgi:tetratricopeptide (TPR) repeat protein
LAKTGKLVEAGNESAMIASSFSADDATNFQNFGVPGEYMVRIAGHIARADIASAKGDWADAVNELKAAVTAQDHLSYTEPPWWDFPTRGFLGAALIQAGRASEAVDVYREDLKEWPKNGWSLYGLSVALRKAGRSREALAAEAAYKKAWVRADVTLRESRF